MPKISGHNLHKSRQRLRNKLEAEFGHPVSDHDVEEVEHIQRAVALYERLAKEFDPKPLV